MLPSGDIKLKWYQKIKPTVEPSMFIYMLAFMITSVYEQAFFVYRACTVNHGYHHDICINIQKHQEIKKIVQVTVSSFHQWNSIIGQIVPIVLALFLGSWSDRYGRKLPLLLGLIGKLIYSTMLIINISQPNWPLQLVIFTATLPCSLTASDVAIFASCFAYISDVSSIKERTLRIGILDACYLSAIPIGVSLGTIIFIYIAKGSFLIMFIINASLLITTIIYSFIFLKWQTNPQQRLLSMTKPSEWIIQFFNTQHVVQSIQTLLRKRSNLRRLYLILFMLSMGFYTFQRNERKMVYLYTQLKFNWDPDTYSYFRTFQSTAYVITMIIGIPVMSKVLNFNDTTMAMIGATAHIIGRIFYGLAPSAPWFYAGALFASFGPIVGPILRSMTSKVVPANERGKVFALLSVFDNAVPMVSATVYSQLYNATIYNHPQSIFWFTVLTQMIVFSFSLIVHITLSGTRLEQEKELENNVDNSSEEMKIVIP